MTQLASKKTTLFIRYFNYWTNQYSNLNLFSQKSEKIITQNQPGHSFLQISSSGGGFLRQGAGVFLTPPRNSTIRSTLEFSDDNARTYITSYIYGITLDWPLWTESDWLMGNNGAECLTHSPLVAYFLDGEMERWSEQWWLMQGVLLLFDWMIEVRPTFWLWWKWKKCEWGVKNCKPEFTHLSFWESPADFLAILID